jgi:hypothetical protein
MSSVDRFSGDYYLKSINGNIYIDSKGGTGTTTITGNLIVVGSQTNIGSIETLISDNIITLAANVTGQPVLNAGIEVRRGLEPTVGIRWNESIDRWQVTNDGSYYGNLMLRVEDDPDPHLGGNLWVETYDMRSQVGTNINFNPGLGTAGVTLPVITGTLAAESGKVVLYARAPDASGSGIYVSNSDKTHQELITKHRAVVYSLVL